MGWGVKVSRTVKCNLGGVPPPHDRVGPPWSSQEDLSAHPLREDMVGRGRALKTPPGKGLGLRTVGEGGSWVGLGGWRALS